MTGGYVVFSPDPGAPFPIPTSLQAATRVDVAALIRIPLVSLLSCQNITPPYHPNYLKARRVQAPILTADVKPVFMTSA